MKKFLFFPAAFTLLLAALPVQAASSTTWDTTSQCRTVLGLDAVSPYVQKILDRADAGLTKAHNARIDNKFLLFRWAQNVQSAWAARISSQAHVTVQADDLIQNSACLRFDMLSIECKIDQVRHEMNAQLARGSFVGILQLIDLLEFLDQRSKQLTLGAHDPEYTDAYWNRVNKFDEPTATFNESMCPYNSDYGPPLLNGYGCDLDVLDSRKSFTPLGKEYDALKLISDQLDNQRQLATQFADVQKQIDDLFHTPSQSPEPQKPRTHLTANGCKWTGGLCDLDPTKHCSTNSECGAGQLCTFPTRVCKEDPSVRCGNDATCFPLGGSTGSCIDQSSVKPATTELRGPFSLGKNHLMLLIDFMAQRIQQGNSRLFKDSLKTPDEFSSSQSSEAEARKKDVINAVLRGSTRYLYATWSRIQGAKEAITFPFATDPSQEVADALSPLRASVGALAKLTQLKPTDTTDNTLRSFVIKYASFLLRSCVYRPCTESLQDILKITFSDQCFPYTNGDFLNDTTSNPRSTKCGDGAGLSPP